MTRHSKEEDIGRSRIARGLCAFTFVVGAAVTGKKNPKKRTATTMFKSFRRGRY